MMSSARNSDIVLLGSIIFIVFLSFFSISCTDLQSDNPPEQPIAFDHKLHVSDYRIPCSYCHMYAERGPVAGVPTLKTCMACHEFIGTERPEVEKLTAHWEEGRPVEWIKIYDLPDFVRFTHKRHVRGEVACEECHGPVGEMTEIRKYVEITMGWCLDCHNRRSADVDCLICHH